MVSCGLGCAVEKSGKVGFMIAGKLACAKLLVTFDGRRAGGGARGRGGTLEGSEVCSARGSSSSAAALGMLYSLAFG